MHPLIPISLGEPKEENKLVERHYLEKDEKISYPNREKIQGEKNPFWKTLRGEPLPLSKLPTRLYNIDLDKLESVIKEKPKVKHYAILSYVWGEPTTPKEKWIDCDGSKILKKLSLGGEKSLVKAVETCSRLKINHLWMDQLCINQEDTEEGRKDREREVVKMRQYYSNADVTLISIQKRLNEEETDYLPSSIEVIKQIINSEWFKRSWTFQEGWLSQRTLFMFDDCLVDGRTLAEAWVLNQPLYTDYVRDVNYSELSNGLKKIATPLGWVYHDEGYDDNDVVSLSLSQALRGIKERNRTLSIDGIYSILGLLPYGSKIIPKYQEVGHKYTRQELYEALLDLMKVAVENGYGEPLAWHGAGKSLLPDVVNVEKGAIGVDGGIVIKQKKTSLGSFIFLSFAPVSIEITGSNYEISKVIGSPTREEGEKGFLIDGSLYARNVKMVVGNKYEEMKLWGNEETLKRIKEGDELVVLDKNNWKSNIPFAVLVTRASRNIYDKLGLVELRSRAEKLQGEELRKIVIREQEMDNYQIQDYQAQIQVAPK